MGNMSMILGNKPHRDPFKTDDDGANSRIYTEVVTSLEIDDPFSQRAK